jgi:hypothetical protein
MKSQELKNNDAVANIIKTKFNELKSSEKTIIREVLDNKEDFIKWPRIACLLFPGITRPKSGFHNQYPSDITEKLRAKEILIDRRTNGPAIMSYRYAGGERPQRSVTNQEWTIHHIYDGKFPFQVGNITLRAVKEGNHFTQSAGLVAIHPIAEALADEYFYFVWQLRVESFRRFGYDPDKIFSRRIDELGFKLPE